MIAQHHDGQAIPDGAYGEGVRLIIVPNDHPIERLGDPPPPGQLDLRLYKALVLEGVVLALTLKAECGRRIRAVV